MKNINSRNILKWYKMLTGKSILHVNQGIGKVYSKNQVLGYYNDLTEKVLKDEKRLLNELPISKTENGEEIIFPIAVFQYGLGCYDLYLLTNEELHYKKFEKMAEWAVNNQESKGGWNNFYYIFPKSPYSAMAQGEGVSLLIRAYIEFKDDRYLSAAEKAISFMLLPVEDGGTTLYGNGEVFFQEYTHKSTVLNGWIFAIFGLYDYTLLTKDKKAQEILEKTLNALENNLSYFDNGYWSMYDLNGAITSPFYHELHIAQLKVLSEIFNNNSFDMYAKKWKKYKRKYLNKKRAFIVKVYQKLTEK